MWASRIFAISILAFCLLLSPTIVAAEEPTPPSSDIERRASILRCTTEPEGRDFTLELVEMTRAQRDPPVQVADKVDKLRKALETAARPAPAEPSLSVGSWRVVQTGGRTNGIFDPTSLALCERGCALHEATSIDTRQWVFVVAKPAERRLQVGWDLSDVKESYPRAPYAVLAWAGYQVNDYVFKDADDSMTPEKGSCYFSTR
jgi:hypothetical protein